VYVAQVGRELPEQGRRDGPAAGEGARLALGGDFPFRGAARPLRSRCRRIRADGRERDRAASSKTPEMRARPAPERTESPDAGRRTAAPARPPPSTCRCRFRPSTGSARDGSAPGPARSPRSSEPPAPGASQAIILACGQGFCGGVSPSGLPPGFGPASGEYKLLRISGRCQHYANHEAVRAPPPALELVGQPLFVTFRLAGSLPANRVFPPARVTSGRAFVALDRFLDQPAAAPHSWANPRSRNWWSRHWLMAKPVSRGIAYTATWSCPTTSICW